MWVVLLIAGLVLYFVPCWVAIARRHRSQLAIGVLTIFLGWTGLGWLAALVWACTSDVEPDAPQIAPAKPVPCPFCAEPIHPAATRCKHCQAELGAPPRRCADCGRVVAADEKHCPTCGFHLE